MRSTGRRKASGLRLANTRETYGLVHQLLHWITAGLILFMIPLGIYMHELPVATPGEVADKVWLYSLHKTVGVTVLFVALARVAWALMQPHPNLIHGGWEAFAAKTVHWLLYGAIVAMPVFGWLHHAALDGYAPIWWERVLPGDWDTLPFVPKSPALAAFFGIAHKVTGLALIGALLLHVGGALKHALIDRDRTLSRMVPGAYAETGHAPSPKGYGRSSVAAAAVVAVLGLGVIAGAYGFTSGGRGQASVVAAGAAVPVSPAKAAVPAAAWTIDRERSGLKIEVTQLGSPVEGTFADWSADVTFDPSRLEEARIEAEIAIASLALGDVSERATSDEFLGAAANPTARFVSDEVVKAGDGYEARGRLTLAGLEKPFVLPFTFEERDGRAIVTAEGTIQRLDFEVGTGFADDSSVGRAVRVIVTIEAARGRSDPAS